MESLPDAPALVLVAITLASALLLIEVALPTFGTAGATAFGLGILVVAMLAQQDDPWWPLVLCALSVSIWAILLATHNPAAAGSLFAAALFAAGSVTYGVLAGDVVTVVLGVVAAVVIAAGFPTLHAAMARLLAGPPQLGMDALVGRTGRVMRFRAGEGTVRVDGVLWTARSTARLRLVAGDEIEVMGYEGMTLDVRPRTAAVAAAPTDGREC